MQKTIVLNIVYLSTILFCALFYYSSFATNFSNDILSLFKIIFGITISIAMFQSKIISIKFFTSNILILTSLIGLLFYYEKQRIFTELSISGISFNTYYLFLFKCISTGFLEEILFRGFIFTGIYKYFYNCSVDKLHKSTFISSTIFALAHLGGFFADNQINLGLLFQVLFAFFMGYLFCGLLVFSRNILFISIVHAFVNHYGGFNSFLYSNREIEVVSLQEYAISMLTLVLIFSILIFPLYYFLTEHKHDWQTIVNPDPYRLEY